MREFRDKMSPRDREDLAARARNEFWERKHQEWLREMEMAKNTPLMQVISNILGA